MNAGELAQLLVAAATLVSSLGALVVAIRTGQKASATHELVNGASEEMRVLREERGHAAGLAEGLVQEARLNEHKPRGPDADRPPAAGAQILGGVPPASAKGDAVPPPGNQPLAARARYLRQGGPPEPGSL